MASGEQHVATVLGPVRPEDLGVTLSHEHLLVDITCYWRPPREASARTLAEAPLEVSSLGRARGDPMLFRSGLVVGAIGLGCGSMSGSYGPADEGEAIRAVHRALKLGVTLLDTADVYGFGGNEELLGKALRGRHEHAVVATKFGQRRSEEDIEGFDGRPEYVRQACESSLRRLGLERIDLYQLHRVDPATPIEETVGAMAELVREGKVRYLGLSEALPEDIRRAAAVAPIATLQSEYSLFERYVEAEILDLCAELGIGFLPYAPLGRGMLTGRLTSREEFGEGDWRRTGPRFQEGNFERNLELVGPVEELARAKGATPGQIALAWLLARRPWIVPIPGTKRVRHLEENAAAADLELTQEEVAHLAEAVPAAAVAGGRYPAGPLLTTWVSPRR